MSRPARRNPIAWTALVVALAGAACASAGRGPERARLEPADESSVASLDAPTPARPPLRFEIGRSRDGRAIEAFDLGGEGPVVLVLGGIHGDEPTSEAVARALLAELRREPRLGAGVHVLILPATNPDGLDAGTRVNARGVDLNRNFPARNWTHAPGRSLRRGDRPASEPETRALAAFVARTDPALIVSIHSIGGARNCNNFDGPARRFAEAMSERNGYPVRASIGYPTPGSLGSWAGIDRGIPTITLELPRGLPSDRAWRDNRAALVDLLRTVAERPGPVLGR